MAAHHLRHYSAVGRDAVNTWDFDPSDDRVLACIRVASGPVVHVPIPVASICTREALRGEFALWGISTHGDTWAIEHGVYDWQLAAPHPLLPDISLILSHAHVNVARHLSRVASAQRKN